MNGRSIRHIFVDELNDVIPEDEELNNINQELLAARSPENSDIPVGNSTSIFRTEVEYTYNLDSIDNNDVDTTTFPGPGRTVEQTPSNNVSMLWNRWAENLELFERNTISDNTRNNINDATIRDNISNNTMTISGDLIVDGLNVASKLEELHDVKEELYNTRLQLEKLKRDFTDLNNRVKLLLEI